MAIINQAIARYYFGAGNPVGNYVKFDGESQPYEIIGVAGDAKYYEIREAVRRISEIGVRMALGATPPQHQAPSLEWCFGKRSP